MAKYDVIMLRRRSKDNGINFCRYAVICNSETGEIVRDDNKRYDKPEHLEMVKKECEEINEIGDYGAWMSQVLEKAHQRYLKSIKK